jgi:hypothetical protein
MPRSLAASRALDNEFAGRVALGLVLAGTIIILLGLGVAAMSPRRTPEDDRITHQVPELALLGDWRCRGRPERGAH